MKVFVYELGLFIRGLFPDTLSSRAPHLVHSALVAVSQDYNSLVPLGVFYLSWQGLVFWLGLNVYLIGACMWSQ